MSSSVISSSSSPPLVSDREAKVPENTKIACTAEGCNQTFSNANELAIHKQKHQMTLKLGSSRTGLTDMLPYDQTPTPTKFLQFGKETGLFDEISNPFDSEFKRNTFSGQSLKEKARRSAVPGLIINNQTMKARTPASFALSTQTGHCPVGQPVHVITLTPTLQSPMLPGAQLFIPPLPSPQGFLQSPALISPSIIPFSAPGLPFPTVQAVVEAQHAAQHAALTQAFINAAHSQSMNLHSEDSIVPSQGRMPRTSSVTELPHSAGALFPTQTVSVPVNNHHTPPTCHAIHVAQNMPAAHIGSASVIQQHCQFGLDQQRRPLSQSLGFTSFGHVLSGIHCPTLEMYDYTKAQNAISSTRGNLEGLESNSLNHTNHVLPTILERKPSFHGETSVITQAPPNSSTAQMNLNMNMHQVNTSAYQYMSAQTSMPPFSQLAVDIAERMPTHSILTSSRSVPTQSHNDIQPHPLPHQNSLPNIDAKQKLKETLTNNNPNLHADLSNIQEQFVLMEEDMNQNEVSSSSGNDSVKTPGRRRGRHSEIDPDRKRMRFLERNRAAARRCRAKKKVWVSGLEVKAKEMSSSNVNLQSEVATLREEIASLKQLLLAHRDCPITRHQQHKLSIAGGDPSAVVSNPIQAAASLRVMANEDPDADADFLLPTGEDIKPDLGSLHMPLTSTISNGSISDNSQDGGNIQMQTSVLVNMNQTLKSEQANDGFLARTPQSAITSAIVLNNTYNGAPTLSTTAST